VGIVASQTPLHGLTSLPYHRDCLMIGVPLGHPLARRKAIRFAEALDYAFVGPHADSSLSALMAEGAKTCGKTVQQRIQVSSFDAMCRLVETRLGITMLPKAVLAPHVAAGRIRMVGLKEDWALRQMFIVVRDPAQLSHITRTLIDHLQHAAASHPA
jgi:DNA-binding transcriptional LysR family regulator